MTKTELISLISASHKNIPEKTRTDAVNLILEQMTNTLTQGGRIEIRGFGSFSLRRWGARYARNPVTGESWRTEPTLAIHFKAGKELRERANDSFKPVEEQSSENANLAPLLDQEDLSNTDEF